MTLLDWLRKLGILRFGAEATVFDNAKERPLSFQEDDVLNSQNDVVHLGKKDELTNKPEGRKAKAT